MRIFSVLSTSVLNMEQLCLCSENIMNIFFCNEMLLYASLFVILIYTGLHLPSTHSWIDNCRVVSCHVLRWIRFLWPELG